MARAAHEAQIEVERGVHRVVVEEAGGRRLRRWMVDCPRGRSKDLNVCGLCPDCRGYALQPPEASTIVCTLWASEEVGGAPPGTVGGAMVRELLCVAPELPAAMALELLSEHPAGLAVLDAADRPVGVLGPFARQRSARGKRTTVRDLMTAPALSARELEPLAPAQARMRAAGARLLVVVDDDGRAIGVVTDEP